jgi:hypothetical protein
MLINLKSLSGNLPPIDIPDDGTVRDLLSLVQQQLGQSKHLQLMLSSDDGDVRILNDTSLMLKSYGVADGCELALTVNDLIELKYTEYRKILQCIKNNSFDSIGSLLNLCCGKFHLNPFMWTVAWNINRSRKGDIIATALAPALEHNTTISSLDFSQLQLKNDGATAMALALQHNSTVTDIELTHNFIESSGATAFAELLKCNSHIKRFSLSSEDGPDGAGLAAIIEALQHNSSINALRLAGFEDVSRTSELICNLFTHNTSITDFSLHSCWLQGRGVAQVAPLLIDNSRLTSLSLRHCQIDSAGAVALGDIIANNSILTKVDISDNFLGSGSSAIGNALKQNSSLTQLNLDGCTIDDLGATALAEALIVNTSLTTLGLLGSSVSPSGCSALGAALPLNYALKSFHFRPRSHLFSESVARGLASNSSVTFVELSMRFWDHPNIEALCSMLQSNVTLTSIKVDMFNLALLQALSLSCSIQSVQIDRVALSAEDAAALVNMLSQQKSISRLEFSESASQPLVYLTMLPRLLRDSLLSELVLPRSFLNNDCATAIAESFLHNTKLTHLDLSHNRIQNEGMTVLANAIMQNESLTSVSLVPNPIDEATETRIRVLLQSRIVPIKCDI